MLQIVTKNQLLRNVKNCYEMLRNVTKCKCYEMLRNVTKCYSSTNVLLRMILILVENHSHSHQGKMRMIITNTELAGPFRHPAGS